ncbi:hypothetical protein [Amycolatopsis sp. NPDC049159]|uniref:hypothetical protein n=1 Tax=Amycolatopsis sp. NPDC049159 TaxID=3157210 RepID=UPI0033F47F80
MSARTTPLCSSTSGPLEPSPGYGPAVSSGISPVDAVVVVEAAEVVAGEEVPQAVSAAPAAPRPWSTTSSRGRGSGWPS